MTAMLCYARLLDIFCAVSDVWEIHQNCCVAFAEPVWQQNPAQISLCAGETQSRISLPRYFVFTNQFPETLLAEKFTSNATF
jgi:hypothetical protein